MTDTQPMFLLKIENGEPLTLWEQIEYDEYLRQHNEGLGSLVGRRVRHGVHPTLEEVADQLIFGHLKGITSREEKADVLTPWKEKNRLSKEVFNVTGTPDPAIRQGMYNRVLNRAKPNLNSRDGIARAAAHSEHTIALKYYTGGSDAGPTDG